MQPTNFSQPTNFGAPESGFGTQLLFADGSMLSDDQNVWMRSAMLGQIDQLSYNMTHGMNLQEMTPAEMDTAYSGYPLLTRQQQPVRVADFDLEQMDDADRVIMSNLENRTRGRPFLCNLLEDKVDHELREKHLFLGRFLDPANTSYDRINLHSMRRTIIET